MLVVRVISFKQRSIPALLSNLKPFIPLIHTSFTYDITQGIGSVCVITYNSKMTAQSEDYFETQTKSCSYFLPPLIHLSRVCVDSGNEKL